jgi:signal transduction histidine kinase
MGIWSQVLRKLGAITPKRGRQRLLTLVGVAGMALVVALISGFVAWSTATMSNTAVTAATAAANHNVARHFADRFRVFSETADMTQVTERLQSLATLNPAVRVYIIDHLGIVRISPSSYGRVSLPFVDPKTLLAAANNVDPSVAILGDDPHHVTIRHPISVAPLRLQSGAYFLYVVLDGANHLSANHSFLGLKISILTTGSVLLAVLLVGGVLARLLYRQRASINTSLAAMSHDLRGPLAAVQGYLETLLEKGDRLSKADAHKCVTVALRSTQSAANLINDLHNVTKLELNPEEIEMEPFSIADLLMDVVISYNQIFEQRSLRVRTEISPALPLGLGNIQLVERLTRNLLENAIRYTPAGARIELLLEPCSQGIRVTVSDTGLGIPESELDRVQKAFFRGSNTSRSTKGSGLGLSICGKIARLHGGELRILSREGEGTAVIFTIPEAPPSRNQHSSNAR